jgi:hypothetical protein
MHKKIKELVVQVATVFTAAQKLTRNKILLSKVLCGMVEEIEAVFPDTTLLLPMSKISMVYQAFMPFHMALITCSLTQMNSLVIVHFWN